MSIGSLKNLALSDNGFVFDPTTGNTFIFNETALTIVRCLIQEKSKEEIIRSILAEYEVDSEELERDYSDTMIHLKELGLYQ